MLLGTERRRNWSRWWPKFNWPGVFMRQSVRHVHEFKARDWIDVSANAELPRAAEGGRYERKDAAYSEDWTVETPSSIHVNGIMECLFWRPLCHCCRLRSCSFDNISNKTCIMWTLMLLNFNMKVDNILEGDYCWVTQLWGHFGHISPPYVYQRTFYTHIFIESTPFSTSACSSGSEGRVLFFF